MQGVRNYESMNTQTVWKFFFVKFHGVGSVKCQIFSVSFLEQTLLYGLQPKFWGFSPFLRVNQILSKFHCCQQIAFSWKINQNLAGKPTEREELPFLCKNLELLILKTFAGCLKLRKYEFSDSLKNSLCWI